MYAVTVVFLSGLGLIVGSFLNVVIYRMRTGMSAVRGRSRCFSCGKHLSVVDLIPVFSFLVLRGKCRRCHVKISWQYPIVECLGLVSVLVPFFVTHPSTGGEYTTYCISVLFFFTLVVMSAYDLKHKIIPDSVSVTLAFLGLLSIASKFNVEAILPASYLYAGVVLPIIFLFLWVVTKGRGIGLGDAKIAVGLGLFLGLSSGIAMLMISFWIGAIISLFLIGIQRVFGKKGLSLKSEIPFGPYLALGTLIVFMFNIDFGTLSEWLSF